MASILQVEELRGPTSGANANKVIVPSGQTLELTDGLSASAMPSGSVVQVVTEMYSTATYISGTTGATILSASITPTNANNSILISATVHGLSDHRLSLIHI